MTQHSHMQHFAMGTWVLLLAYAVSVLGSVVGLACTRQAAAAADRSEAARLRWLLLAAFSIGGVGIWLMHFIAMLGFSVPDSVVRFDVLRTAISAVLSIAATFLGLLIVGRTLHIGRLLLAGAVTGTAVALMHYTGMWAVQIQGEIGYDAALVALSVVIAIAAATTALWFTLALDGTVLRLVGGLAMGVAVVGMHYTGMFAVEVDVDPSAPRPSGIPVFAFLFPVFVLGVLAMAIPIVAVLMAPEADSGRRSGRALGALTRASDVEIPVAVQG